MIKELTVIWQPLVWLRQQLLVWLTEYIDEESAHRIVRLALAEWVQCAMTAWPTECGPYPFAIDLAQAHLARMINVWENENLFWVRGPSYRPTEEELEKLCKAYAIIYETGYLADFSWSQREQIIMLIRLYEVTAANNMQIRAYVAYARDDFAPLRRAVQALDEHEPATLLVCSASAQIAEDERNKSYAWLRHWPADEEMKQ